MEQDPQHTLAPQLSAPEPGGPVAAELPPVVRPVASSATAVRPRASAGRLLNLALLGAFVIAVGGIAFAVGRMTAPAAAVTGANFPGGFTGNGQGNPGAGGFQGRPGNGQAGFGGLGGGLSLEGTVESVSDTTLTLKTADGQTIQVALNGATTYHAQTDATSSDVVTGAKVLVRLQLGRVDGGGNGPSATAGTRGLLGNATAGDVTVVP